MSRSPITLLRSCILQLITSLTERSVYAYTSVYALYLPVYKLSTRQKVQSLTECTPLPGPFVN